MPTKVNVSLTRRELADVVVGLGRQIKAKRDAMHKAQKREAGGSERRPGNISGRAMEMADLQDLRERLVRCWTDAELEESVRDAGACAQLQREQDAGLEQAGVELAGLDAVRAKLTGEG